ncbi:MAG TPA: XdhC family protein [Polyangiaceae bacterium]|nr:XdhC family protein [Polyangiaceae bacterium]
MTELRAFCRAARALQEHQEPAWIATVVRVRGSAFRQPGARMLFTTGRVVCGSISGGCLENDLVRRGPWLCESRPTLLNYDARTEEEDGERVGTGCDGAIDVLVERLDLRLLAFLEQCLARGQRGVVITITRAQQPTLSVGARVLVAADGSNDDERSLLASVLGQTVKDAFESGRSQYVEWSPGNEALIEVLEPPPNLFVFGAGPDAFALVRLAQGLGFDVSVCSAAPRATLQERFASCPDVEFVAPADVGAKIVSCSAALGVVMTHSFQNDREALAILLTSKATYIGVLGPARRCARLLSEIDPSVRTPAVLRRVHGPAGLHLGGSSPAEVALSILSEAQAVLNAASGVSLRDRKQPIHSRITESRPHLRLAEAT